MARASLANDTDGVSEMLFISRCCSSEKGRSHFMTSLIQTVQIRLKWTKLSQVQHGHIITALRNVKVNSNTTAAVDIALTHGFKCGERRIAGARFQTLSLSKSTIFEFVSWLLVIPQITVEVTVSIASFILRKMNCGHSLAINLLSDLFGSAASVTLVKFVHACVNTIGFSFS